MFLGRDYDDALLCCNSFDANIDPRQYPASPFKSHSKEEKNAYLLFLQCAIQERR
jgi:hypothetical protein